MVVPNTEFRPWAGSNSSGGAIASAFGRVFVCFSLFWGARYLTWVHPGSSASFETILIKLPNPASVQFMIHGQGHDNFRRTAGIRMPSDQVAQHHLEREPPLRFPESLERLKQLD